MVIDWFIFISRHSFAVPKNMCFRVVAVTVLPERSSMKLGTDSCVILHVVLHSCCLWQGVGPFKATISETLSRFEAGWVFFFFGVQFCGIFISPPYTLPETCKAKGAPQRFFSGVFSWTCSCSRTHLLRLFFGLFSGVLTA